MAKGAWLRMLTGTVLFRQAMVMGDDEEPLNPDPYGLIDTDGDAGKSNHMPYNPAVLESLQSRTGE